MPAGDFLVFLYVLVWLPLLVILGQWYTVLATFISIADENEISLACNQYIRFLIYCYSFFFEDGHVAIVSCFTNTHYKCW